MTPDDATAAQGGRALSRTKKLGMWRVGGIFGTSAGEERLPVVMERACLARVGERGKEWSQAGKGT